MRPVLQVAVVFAVLAAGCGRPRKSEAEGQTPEPAQQRAPDVAWVQFTPADGHFKAEFPGRPKHTVPPGYKAHEYVAETRGGATAFLIRFTPEADTDLTVDERLEQTTKAMKSTNVKIVAVTVGGHAGKEMSHERVADGTVYLSRQRMFFAGGNLYQLVVLAEKAQGFPEEDARRFFSGFQLLTP